MTFPRQVWGGRTTVVFMIAYGCIVGMLQATNADADPPAVLWGTWQGTYKRTQESTEVNCTEHTIFTDGTITQDIYETDTCTGIYSDAPMETWNAQLLDVTTLDYSAASGGVEAIYYRMVFQYTNDADAYFCALVHADETQMVWLEGKGASTQTDAEDSCPVLTSSSKPGEIDALHAVSLAHMTKVSAAPVTATPAPPAPPLAAPSWSTATQVDYSSSYPRNPPVDPLAVALVVPIVAYCLVAGALLLHMSIRHKLKVKHRAAFGDADGLVKSTYQEGRNWHRCQLTLNIMTWAGYILLVVAGLRLDEVSKWGCIIPGSLLFGIGWPLTFLIWAISLCTGRKASKYLDRKAQCNPSTLVAALKRLQAMPVDIQATINCYHMETRTTWVTTTDSNGNSTSSPQTTVVPVTTFTATDHLHLAACVDQTGNADALSHITECTRVRIVVCCEAEDELSAATYNNMGPELERAHAHRDELHSITYATLVNGKAEHCYLVAPTSSCAVCMISHWVYFLFVLVSWNWIYLVWLDSVSNGIVIKLRKRYKVLSDAPSGAPPIAYPSAPPTWALPSVTPAAASPMHLK